MPEYLSPGVYVEEVSFRAKSIEGVPTQHHRLRRAHPHRARSSTSSPVGVRAGPSTRSPG